MSLFFGNCQTAEVVTYLLSATPSDFTFEGYGDSGSITVESNDSWEASTGEDWIKIDSGSGEGNGTIMFHVEANTDALSRQGSIVIVGTASGLSTTIDIYQNPV